jgi:hypothetical protein
VAILRAFGYSIEFQFLISSHGRMGPIRWKATPWLKP